MTYEEKKILYDFHKENSDRIEKERSFQQHSFDSWLLKLCAGSFAVSFAFIEKLIDFSAAVCKPVLILGWICFSACLVLSVFGFMNSEKLCHIGFVNEWNKYKNETENKNIKISRNFRNRIARFLNYASFALFTGGVLCLIIFLAKNI